MTDMPDWVLDYIESLGKRFSPFDWPNHGTEDSADLAGDFWDAFDAAKVTEDEATRAARRLSLNPPERNRRLDYLPAVMGVVRTMRAERAPADVGAMDRPSAEAASRTCPHCEGSGWASVFRPGQREAAPGKPYTFAIACNCPLGRFFRRGQLKDRPNDKTPDFGDVLRGSTGYRQVPPFRPEPDTPEADPGEMRRRLNEAFKPAPAGAPF